MINHLMPTVITPLQPFKPTAGGIPPPPIPPGRSLPGHWHFARQRGPKQRRGVVRGSEMAKDVVRKMVQIMVKS